MGHFHSANLSSMAVKLMYAKGSVSIDQCVKVAQERGEVVHASEGTYDEKYMLQNGFESIFWIWYDNHCLEVAEPTTAKQEAIQAWISGDIWDNDHWDENGESTGDLKIVDSIAWKFAKGWRKNYLKMVIDEIDA